MSIWLEPAIVDDISKKITRIHYLITQYGLKNFKKARNLYGKIKSVHDLQKYLKNPTGYREFIKYVHEGFQKGQLLIIDELLAINTSRDECVQALRVAKKEKKKDEITKLGKRLSSLINQEAIIRRLADAVAWQMFNHHTHIARRLYVEGGPCSIKSSNLKDGKDFIINFNTKNSLQFALLTDLTSFIHIGDVLLVDKSGKGPRLGIMELKDGVVNKEICKNLNFYYQGKITVEQLIKDVASKGEDYIKQLTRVYKQDEKIYARVNIINKDGGCDFNGTNVKISKDFFVLHFFHDRIRHLLNISKKKKWAIDCVDGCLFIGVYQEGFSAYEAFILWMRALKIKFPIHDFRMAYKIPCSSSPFLIPLLSRTEIIKIALGEIKILFCLDYEAWFKIADKIDLKLQWAGRKETMDELKKGKGKKRELIVVQDKGVKIVDKSRSILLGTGVWARIFCDWTIPISIIEMFKHSIEDGIKD